MKSDQNLLEHLRRAAGSGAVVIEEPMSRHTTFRIGGPADYFVTPHTKEEIRQVSGFAKRKRSPLLFSEMEAISWWEIRGSGALSFSCLRIFPISS